MELKGDKALGTYALQTSQEYLDLLSKVYIETDRVQSKYLGEPTREDFMKSYSHTQENLLIELLRWLSFTLYSLLSYNDLSPETKEVLSKYMKSANPEEFLKGYRESVTP